MIRHELVTFETPATAEDYMERSVCLCCGMQTEWRALRILLMRHPRELERMRRFAWQAWQEASCPLVPPADSRVNREWLQRLRQKYWKDRGPHVVDWLVPEGATA